MATTAIRNKDNAKDKTIKPSEDKQVRQQATSSNTEQNTKGY